MNTTRPTVAIGTTLYSRHSGAMTVTAVGPFLTATVNKTGRVATFPADLVVKADARGLANPAAVFIAADYAAASLAKYQAVYGRGGGHTVESTLRSLLGVA